MDLKRRFLNPFPEGRGPLKILSDVDVEELQKTIESLANSQRSLSEVVSLVSAVGASNSAVYIDKSTQRIYLKALISSEAFAERLEKIYLELSGFSVYLPSSGGSWTFGSQYIDNLIQSLTVNQDRILVIICDLIEFEVFGFEKFSLSEPLQLRTM